MRLVELFDKPVTDIEWEETVFGEEARFNIGDSTYNIHFTPIPPEAFEDERSTIPKPLMAMIDNNIYPIGIEFELYNDDHNGTHDITGTGNEIKVFSTVASVVKQWIWDSRKDVQLVYIAAKEPSRIKLYRRLVNTFSKGKKVWELKDDVNYTYWVVKL